MLGHCLTFNVYTFCSLKKEILEGSWCLVRPWFPFIDFVFPKFCCIYQVFNKITCNQLGYLWEYSTGNPKYSGKSFLVTKEKKKNFFWRVPIFESNFLFRYNIWESFSLLVQYLRVSFFSGMHFSDTLFYKFWKKCF